MMRLPVLLFNLALLSLLIVQSGCSSSPSTRGRASSQYADPATWLSIAGEMERKGDLHAALYNLRVARTVSRRDKRINADIKRLEARIAELSEKHMRQGKRAVRQGKLTQARRHYLKVLSLDPRHKQALDAMRELETTKSKLSMKKKVATSNRNYNHRAKKAELPKDFNQEAYIYSRQDILQAEDKQMNPNGYIKEIESHLEKYPKDKEVQDRLSKTLIEQIDRAFESENYQGALNYIKRAERAFKSDSKRLAEIQQQRKSYGKKLYIKGIRSSRETPNLAITYWEYAIQFDPDHEKSRLRLRKIRAM